MAFTAFAAATLGLASLTASEAETPKQMILAQAQPYLAQSYVAPQGGDYMTTPEGCTYRRTQAPGYPPRWILVLNPHHVGKGVARGKCSGMR